MRPRFPFLLCFLVAGTAVLSAGDSELVQQGRDLIAQMAYEKAVPVLEEAVAQNKQDAAAAGLLGMAYLYSSQIPGAQRNAEKAENTYIQALDLNGSASFLVSLAKDKIKGPNVLKAVPGSLMLYRDRVEFVPERSAPEDHLFIGGGDLKECGHSHGYGKSSNTFFLKTRKGDFLFRPHHFSPEEGDLVCKLTAKYFGAKSVP
jgi:tetratricopeptide (TPR) repeat protein